MKKEKRFDVGETISINGYMSHDYAGEKFCSGGNELLLETILNHAKKIGKNIVGTCIYPKARIKYYGSFNHDKDCYEIVVEWIDPFDNNRLLPNLHTYYMLESEFREFTEPIYRERKGPFKPGDWVYYMGEAAGGIDTGPEHWHEGLIGQISNIEDSYLRFDKIGKMLNAGNRICAFRKATHSEIMNAAHEEFVSKNGPTFNSLEPISIKNKEDEIKVSFQSTKLIANKVTNSREVENFLLLN